MEYIEEELLIVTTSFDKKVKIWDAKTGEYLDSLQQNYNKNQAVPIAYYNTKTSTLYSSDLKSSKTIQQVNPIKAQFDPFIFEKILEENNNIVKIKSSNQQWKINVDFRGIATEEMKKFEDLANDISQLEENTTETKLKNRVLLSEIKKKFEKQKKALKILVDDTKDPN